MEHAIAPTIDHISNLPEPILRSILSLLPPKEAAATSILSHRWRSVWTSLAKVDLRMDLVKCTCKVTSSPCSCHCDQLHRWKTAARNLVESQVAPINWCQITSEGKIWPTDLNALIVSLKKKEIQGLALRFPCCLCDQPVSPNLFRCDTLRVLELRCCKIKLFPEFEGFPNLKTLRMDLVAFSEATFLRLVNCSKLLEHLILCRCSGFRILEIRSARLQSFHVTCSKKTLINLMQTPRLVQFCGHLQYADHRCHDCSLMKLLKGLTHVECLSLEAESLMDCSSSCFLLLPKDVRFTALRKLNAVVNLSRASESAILAFLLENSPKLEELVIRRRRSVSPGSSERPKDAKLLGKTKTFLLPDSSSYKHNDIEFHRRF